MHRTLCILQILLVISFILIKYISIFAPQNIRVFCWVAFTFARDSHRGFGELVVKTK